VEYVGPASGHAGFRVTLDGSEILGEKGRDRDAHVSADGVVHAKYDLMDPSNFHREARHTIGASAGSLLPSYLFNLGPDLIIYMLLGPDNMNAIIETRKTAGLQDGYCGNFNCNPADDDRPSGELAAKLQPGDSLFRFGSKLPVPKYMTNAEGKVHTVKDCPPIILNEASKRCGIILSEAEQAACIFDVCASRDANVAGGEVAVAALGQELDHDVDNGQPFYQPRVR